MTPVVRGREGSPGPLWPSSPTEGLTVKEMPPLLALGATTPKSRRHRDTSAPSEPPGERPPCLCRLLGPLQSLACGRSPHLGPRAHMASSCTSVSSPLVCTNVLCLLLVRTA